MLNSELISVRERQAGLKVEATIQNTISENLAKNNTRNFVKEKLD